MAIVVSRYTSFKLKSPLLKYHGSCRKLSIDCLVCRFRLHFVPIFYLLIDSTEWNKFYRKKRHFLHNLIARNFPSFNFQIYYLDICFSNVVLINVLDSPRTSQTRQVVDCKHIFFFARHLTVKFTGLNELLSLNFFSLPIPIYKHTSVVIHKYLSRYLVIDWGTETRISS